MNFDWLTCIGRVVYLMYINGFLFFSLQVVVSWSLTGTTHILHTSVKGLLIPEEVSVMFLPFTSMKFKSSTFRRALKNRIFIFMCSWVGGVRKAVWNLDFFFFFGL